MPAVAILGSMGSGHGSFSPRPSIEGDPLVTINGVPVMVNSNAFPPHTDGKTSHPGVAVSSRPWFSINGKGIVCVGDNVSCGSVIVTGDTTMQVS